MPDAPTTPAPARGRPRDPSRDQAILEAALELTAEVGYDRVSMDALAARAHVGKPTIYRRWPGGKPEILVEAIRARRTQTFALPDTGTLRGDLVAVVRARAADLRENSELAAGLTSRMRANAELAEIFREHIVEDERERFRSIVARAADRGELASGSVTHLFPDVAPALVYTRLVLLGDPVDDAFVDELVDRVLLPILTNPPKDR